MLRLLFLLLIAAAYAAACFLSPAQFWMTDSPRLEKIADLPDTPAVNAVKDRIYHEGIVVKIDKPELPPEASPIALGYSLRTFEALKLPLAVYADEGLVLYSESRASTKLLPVDAETQAALAAALGHDPVKAYSFPWLRFTWGWGFALALAVWLFFQFRHERLRAEIEPEE